MKRSYAAARFHGARLSFLPIIGVFCCLGFAVGSLRAVTTIQLDHLLNAPGSPIDVLDANSLKLVRAGAGTLTNNGSLNLKSIGDLTDLVISGGDITFDGTGTITMSNNGANRIYGETSTDRLINSSGHTIQGSGQVGSGLLTIANQGFIIANQSSALTVSPNSGGLANTGTLRAANGATLVLSGSGGGAFTNTGGTIEATGTSSRVELSNAAITGGTFTTSSGGKIVPTGGTTLNGVTFASGANLEQADGITTKLSGTITNGGTLSLQSSYYGSILSISGSVTLAGNGTVTLSDHGANIINGTVSTDRFINQNNTIQGSGQIGANAIGLTNQGTIIANQPTALVLDPSDAGAINTGTLRASNGGTLRLQGGTFTNTGGTIDATGTSASGAASRVELSSVTINGGTFTSSSSGKIVPNGGVTLGNVAFASGALLEQPDGVSTSLSGTISNSGVLSLLSSYYGSTLTLPSGNVTLTGNGTVTLSNHGANTINGANATDRFINENNTIQGAGQIGANAIGFTNRGTVIASGSAGLTLDPSSASSVINSGTLKAASGGVLTLSSGTFTNAESTTSGTIRADGGKVVFNSAATSGGNVDVIGAGQIEFSSSTLAQANLINSATGTLRTTNGNTVLDRVVFTNPSGGLFNVNDGTALTLNANGTYANTGTLKLDSSYYGSTLTLAGGDVTLGGGGTLQLSNHGGNVLTGAAATDRLVNENNVIQGSGQLGNNGMGLVNRGTIRANQSTALTIDPSSTGAVNSGTMEATNGATLALNNGTFANSEGTTPGLIRATANSTVSLNNATIRGGQLATSGNGKIVNTGTAAFDGVTVLGGAAVSLNDGTRLDLTGSIANGGVVSLLASYYGTTVYLPIGDATLTGGGTFDLTNHGGNVFSAAAASSRLINQDNTLQGSGQLGNDSMGFVNRGTVLANSSTGLTLDPASTATVTNSGLMKAASGGLLTLNGGSFVNNEGTANGTIRAEGGKVRFVSAATSGGNVDVVGAGQVEFSSSTLAQLNLLNSSTGTLRTTGGATTLDQVAFTNPSGGLFNINDGSALTLKANGSYANSGTLRLDSSYYGSTLTVAGGDVVLSGGGKLQLSNHGGNVLGGATATDRLVNQDNVIEGSGQLGNGSAGVVNRGTIRANQSTDLTLHPSSAGVVNSGMLESTNGATLALTGGTFTNFENTTAGTIQGNGGRVTIGNATVQGGRFSTLNGGTIAVNSATTLDKVQVTSGSVLNVSDGVELTLTNSFVNNGTLALNSGYYGTTLTFGTNLTLNDGGVISLSNHGGNVLRGANGGITLNNQNNTIRGSGQLGANQLTLNNTGTIEANQSTPLTIDVANASPFTNQGVLRANNGANLIVVHNFANSALIDVKPGSSVTGQGTLTQAAGGVTILNNGTLTAASHAFQTGGVLQGAGTINGPFTNGGVIIPGTPVTTGAGIGQLTFNHALTLTSTSLLHMEIGGLNDYDKILAPSAALDGLLVISVANGFQSTIQSTDSFALLSTSNANGLSGTFTGLANGSRIFTADGFGSFQVNYLANSFTLSNFAAVPEPSTYALIALGGVVLFLVRRRRGSRS